MDSLSCCQRSKQSGPLVGEQLVGVGNAGLEAHEVELDRRVGGATNGEVVIIACRRSGGRSIGAWSF